ncbi:hypothetical protein [Chryseobacterium timonianum]|uniref:hypothetical protein n=1 Tax=Chryseobacterium timonianum TaxID=1805473 RepID=UPI00083A6B9D|nr:hypothetical protein [Chryseobacterium timonianum]
MGKQASATTLACEETKKRLIAKIESMDCNDLLIFEKEKKIFINEVFILDPLGDHPISPESKNGQVTAAGEIFSLFPEKFIIKKIGSIIDQYRKSIKYLYVYFLFENGDVNIAFLFKNDFYTGNLFSISEGEALYVLRNNELTLQSEAEYPKIRNAVIDFESFFQQEYGTSKLTKYIIYTMDLINRNFNSFEDITEILVGALPYGKNINRPNLILKIQEKCVDIVVFDPSENGYYFFNMGHLYP